MLTVMTDVNAASRHGGEAEASADGVGRDCRCRTVGGSRCVTTLLQRLWTLEEPWAQARCLDKVKKEDGTIAVVVLDQHALYTSSSLANALFAGIQLLLEKAPGNPLVQLPLPGLLRLAQIEVDAFKSATCVLRTRDNTSAENFAPGSGASRLLAAGLAFAAKDGDTLLRNFGSIVTDVLADREHGWRDALDASSRLRQANFDLSAAKSLFGIAEVVAVTLL